MNKIVRLLVAFLTFAFVPATAVGAQSTLSFTKLWTHTHSARLSNFLSEIAAFDERTNTMWVAGAIGVDVLDAGTGAFIDHINTTGYGSINSVAIHDGLAAFAIEARAPLRNTPGVVVFYDTKTRALAEGPNVVTVGALPDMLTFTHDGRKLLVANEGTPNNASLGLPNDYGPRTNPGSVPFVFGPGTNDPTGSVTIIDVQSRSVIAHAGFAGVPITGPNVRTTTGMDFEPEYITVDHDGHTAYVTLQEANAIGVLDLKTNAFIKVVGLGAKDFSLPGNEIDPLDNDGKVIFGSHPVKGLYMPDAIAAYKYQGRTYLIMANEGDFREDDADRVAANSNGLGGSGALARLRVSATDSSPGNLFAAGARSMSIRDTDGNIVYDSGSILDREADKRKVYDDGRSRDKGVEPEGVALLEIGNRTYAFVGLERTLKAAVAVFDVTIPHETAFVDMIVTDGDVAPEGVIAYRYKNEHYLAIANEVSSTTTLYRIDTDRERK